MKKMKACVSALLVIAILLSTALPSLASSDQCACGFSPVVYVSALGSADLYLDVGSPNERKIFEPESADIIKLIGQLIIPLLRYFTGGDAKTFAKSLGKAIDGLMGELAMDENGDSNPRIGTKQSLPDNPEHDPYKSYYFAYDFRIDPLLTAQDLKAYVEHVKELTGHQKVSFKASSLGGIIVMAYLDKYGHDDLDAIIFQNCPLLGVAMAGDLFTKKLELNSDALVSYGVQALPQIEGGIWLEPLIRLLDFVGLFETLIGFGNTLVDDIKDDLYDEMLIPIFGKMPCLWALIPHESYEEAKELFLDESASQIFIDRIDYYHYHIQGRTQELLDQALQDDVRIMILAGYNLQREPFVESYMNNSDGVDDTVYNAPGAICADIGQTLGEGYVQAVQDGHNHLSADGVIDASTCYLPENTWFIRDMLHSTAHAGHKDFYAWFLSDPQAPDVHSNPDYPQFMQNDTANERLLPLTEKPAGDSLKPPLLQAFNSFINSMEKMKNLYQITEVSL